VPILPSRRIAHNARRCCVPLFERQSRESADNRLKLIVIWRAARRFDGSGFNPSDFQAACG
jgi:hypothetical protein